MTPVEPCGFMPDPEARSLDPRSQLPITPTAAMVRQAEVDAAYLAVAATRADPIYRVEIQAKAAEARERAHRLRAALGRPMPANKSGADLGDRLSTDPLDLPACKHWPLNPAAEPAFGAGFKA